MEYNRHIALSLLNSKGTEQEWSQFRDVQRETYRAQDHRETRHHDCVCDR